MHTLTLTHAHTHSKYLEHSCTFRAKSELPEGLRGLCGLPHSSQVSKCLDSDPGSLGHAWTSCPQRTRRDQPVPCPSHLGPVGGNLLQARPFVPIAWLSSSFPRDTWPLLSSSVPSPAPDPVLVPTVLLGRQNYPHSTMQETELQSESVTWPPDRVQLVRLTAFSSPRSR